MDEKAKAARRAYKREWQRKNRDKCRKYEEDYWSRKAEAAGGVNHEEDQEQDA